jgi:glucokinase
MTKSIGMIVAGEIGPTETRLALCGLDVGRPIVVVEETAPNAAFTTFAPMVQRFLRKYRPPQIRAAAFVAPGPVLGGISLAPDLPWAIGAQALASELGIDKVTILTDAEGVAHAIPALAHEDIASIGGGSSDENANQVVLSAGASPSVAGLYWDGTEHRSFASDAGHADFAPASEEELRLALHLASSGVRAGRVTLEVVLSRVGLALIHGFVGGADAPAITPVAGEDPAATILRKASSGDDPMCRKAVDLFLAVYAGAAANLALTLRATGGVYLAGDIVPSFGAPLTSGGDFQAAFCRKPPMEEALAKVPIRAVLNPRAALLGAATVAARGLRTQRGGGWAS